MNNFGKNLALWVIIGLLLIALFQLFQGSSQRGETVKRPYSEFVQLVDKNQVREVTIKGNTINGTLADGTRFTTLKPAEDPKLIERLLAKNVKVEAAPAEERMNPILAILINWFPQARCSFRETQGWKTGFRQRTTTAWLERSRATTAPWESMPSTRMRSSSTF